MKKLILLTFASIILFVGCNKERVKELNTSVLEPYFGTYLPETYLDELDESKSHVKASDELREVEDYCPNVVVLNDECLECNFNFHEGYSAKLVEVRKDLIIVESSDGLDYCRLEGNYYLYIGETKYIKISECEKMDNKVISNYLAENLLPEMELQDENNSLSISDGEINYNGESYRYGTSLVFLDHYYDYIENTESLEKKYIEILDNKINIYNAVYSDENRDSDWETGAEYVIESSFTF